MYTGILDMNLHETSARFTNRPHPKPPSRSDRQAETSVAGQHSVLVRRTPAIRGPKVMQAVARVGHVTSLKPSLTVGVVVGFAVHGMGRWAAR